MKDLIFNVRIYSCVLVGGGVVSELEKSKRNRQCIPHLTNSWIKNTLHHQLPLHRTNPNKYTMHLFQLKLHLHNYVSIQTVISTL